MDLSATCDCGHAYAEHGDFWADGMHAYRDCRRCTCVCFKRSDV